MNEMFSPKWIEQANELLRGHETGAVGEFSATLEVVGTEPNACQFWMIAQQGGITFSAEAPERIDCSIRGAGSLLKGIFSKESQEEYLNAAIYPSGIEIGGDMAKIKFFSGGLIRGASSELIAKLRALG